ncbi:MAG: molybdate ABC transporter substrate-binding protein [Actinobacteria bacterium]|nr:MAG: molybdate ABC transporter substrate-binding protein [Actinomycetota bacterium]
MRGRRSIPLLVALLTLAACGSSKSNTTTSNGSTSSSSGKPTLVISAAASLKKAFTTYGTQFSAASARFSFAGSDMLAAQIEQGVRPDVFASANTKLPAMLYGKGLVDKPVVFAANKLVLAVPAGSSKVKSLADVEKPGTVLVVGTPTVPVGDYTNTVLARLTPAQHRAVLASVKDREPDVTAIVGKLSQGAADAGFLYITDVKATDGKLKAIDLPASLQPRVAYGVAVIKGAPHPSQAQQFVAGLVSGAGRGDLRADGFLPPS